MMTLEQVFLAKNPLAKKLRLQLLARLCLYEMPTMFLIIVAPLIVGFISLPLIFGALFIVGYVVFLVLFCKSPYAKNLIMKHQWLQFFSRTNGMSERKRLIRLLRAQKGGEGRVSRHFLVPIVLVALFDFCLRKSS